MKTKNSNTPVKDNLPGKPVDPKVWSNTLKVYEDVKRWGNNSKTTKK
jgi:hypothetical protein